MDSGRGKSITTSVPSMAIRFNATAEEIEEVYASEEEQNDTVADIASTTRSAELESSPRRLILPLLGKRATSIDTNTAQDASPPSDPWRFLSDIKGKITKSVEGKLTEYKARSHDGDGSPKLTKVTKDSKENSSLSDSEEVSESSISKTCGIVSTTEGVEMSSDDDETPSLPDKDKPQTETAPHLINSSSNPNLRQRFRITSDRNTVIKEGSVAIEFLEGIQKVNDSLTSADSEIESGIDVLADLNISNFHVDDDNVLNVMQLSGSELRNEMLSGNLEGKTVFSPTGYVDLRIPPEAATWFDVAHSFRHVIFALMTLFLYITLPLTVYFSGFITGALVMIIFFTAYIKFFLSNAQPNLGTYFPQVQPLLQIPAVKEHLPLKKYEGWVNEYPEHYNPHTYHVSQTQSVYLRVQGNFLRISHGRQRIPKRAMWHEPEHKLVFTNHRVYNLRGAKVSLLPVGLAKVRLWSKKYPICITLSADQVHHELPVERRRSSLNNNENRKKELEKAQVYSRLVSEDEEPSSSVDSSIRDPDANPDSAGSVIRDSSTESKMVGVEEDDEDDFSLTSWHDITHTEGAATDVTHLYFFTRTGRDKEEWFRRLKIATYKMPGVDPEHSDEQDNDEDLEAYQPQSPSAMLEDEYLKFMGKLSNFINATDEPTETKHSKREEHKEIINRKELREEREGNESHWINAFMGRVMFDSLREEWLLLRIKDRLQRKLASIKLPYFIQELCCEELKLGSTAPYITNTNKPILNSRGLWIDLDFTYEGLFCMTLQTKLELMKLKQPHLLDEKVQKDKEKSAIFHSDVDDSAESTTDDEHGSHRGMTSHSQTTLDSTGNPVSGLGGSNTKTKKLIKMVDKFAESKFFQAASEMKYIKKAMEGVSNTDIRLKVEVRKCTGTLVINIPPPPSDRIWFGFRYPPELTISAHPIVGERNLNMNQLMSWIEKKIYKEFQKILVVPNMEDFSIPVMSPKLPE